MPLRIALGCAYSKCHHNIDDVLIIRVREERKMIAPHGQSSKEGQLWCAIAETKWGRIPGKSDGFKCWFGYNGQEHEASKFEIYTRQGVGKTCEGIDPCGNQKAGSTSTKTSTSTTIVNGVKTTITTTITTDCTEVFLWCAVANTSEGKIPGKADASQCWYTLDGRELAATDFEFVGATQITESSSTMLSTMSEMTMTKDDFTTNILSLYHACRLVFRNSYRFSKADLHVCQPCAHLHDQVVFICFHGLQQQF
jgi:hypothetical protein